MLQKLSKGEVSEGRKESKEGMREGKLRFSLLEDNRKEKLLERERVIDVT